ncbi:MAG: hypothetical protein Ta2E_10740 [Mycoplasmoidaceae bacterium]|nr:MAG: hypothetical protein Ta2E_10740 [Mycoplasmoidaceae bacterium]
MGKIKFVKFIRKANKVILNDKKRFWSQSQSFIRKKTIRNDMFFFGKMDKSENLSYRKTVKTVLMSSSMNDLIFPNLQERQYDLAEKAKGLETYQAYNRRRKKALERKKKKLSNSNNQPRNTSETASLLPHVDFREEEETTDPEITFPTNRNENTTESTLGFVRTENRYATMEEWINALMLTTISTDENLNATLENTSENDTILNDSNGEDWVNRVQQSKINNEDMDIGEIRESCLRHEAILKQIRDILIETQESNGESETKQEEDE